MNRTASWKQWGTEVFELTRTAVDWETVRIAHNVSGIRTHEAGVEPRPPLAESAQITPKLDRKVI